MIAAKRKPDPLSLNSMSCQAALRRKMKIPSAEKANLRTPQLRNRRRLAQGCRLPRLTGGNLVKDADETGYFREDGARDDLMPRHDRKFSRHLRHPGSLERGKELLGKVALRFNLSS